MFEKHTDSNARLIQWREVRKTAMSEQDVLEAFSTIKPRTRYLDWYNPDDWYNPFDILEHGCFCTTGISILLYHTLANLNYIDTELTEWKVISNHSTGHEGAVFKCNGMYYNVLPGKTVLENTLSDYATILVDHGKLEIDLV